MNQEQQTYWIAEQVQVMDQMVNQILGIGDINPCHTHSVLGNLTVPQENNTKEEKMSIEENKQYYLADRLREAVQTKKDKAKVTFGLTVDPEKRDETGYFKARAQILKDAQSVKDTVMIATPEEALKAIQAYEAN